MPAFDLNNVPEGAEVWRTNDGHQFLTYFVPNTDPPVPMTWHIETDEELQALFGDRPVSYDKTFASVDQMRSAGALDMGARAEISSESEQPFKAFVNRFESELEVRPWLRDPEMLALVTSAVLEGRSVTEAEWQTTDWWQNHSDQERKWLQLANSDPSTAAQVKNDNRNKIEQALRDAGIANPSASLVNRLADNMSRGSWSNSYVQQQINLLADPFASGTLDQQLRNVAPDTPQTAQGEETARQLFDRWLGPYANRSEESIQYWAGRLRNDPDAEQELTEQLRKQKTALFPEYNENATWEDIASPWKNFIQNEWGQVVKDDNTALHKVVKLNDANDAADFLRREGLKQGVEKVVENAVSGAMESFGGVIPTGA